MEWANAEDPTKGFKYLFLSPEDHASLAARGAAAGAPAVQARRTVTPEGEERFVLTGAWGWGAGGAGDGSLREPGACGKGS